MASSFYWTAVIKRLVQSEANATVTASEVSYLAEARMALATQAVHKQDMTTALGLYSQVKTSHSSWNQSQVTSSYLVISLCSLCPGFRYFCC